MKKTTFTLLLSLSCYWLAAQCPTGDITFSTQGQIDSFPINYPGCTHPVGNVTIYETATGNILHLDSLLQIDSIGGYLYVGFNDSLTSLSGLDSLTSIGGYLYVAANAALTSLSALTNLTSIGGSLSVSGGTALTSLSGLGNLTSIGGSLGVRYNAALTSLIGLDNLTSIGGNLEVQYNAALTSFSGLGNLASIGGYVEVGENDSLTSLSGLDNLSSIGGDLSVYNNTSLTSLSGLKNLTSIGGDLSVSNNASLTSLSGLDSLTFIGEGFWMYNNAVLTSLNGLDNLTSIGGGLHVFSNSFLTSLSGLDNIDPVTITGMYITDNPQLSLCSVQSICDYLDNDDWSADIGGNAPGCNDVWEIAAACQIFLCPLGGVVFSTQGQVDSFQIIYRDCSKIKGSVTISGSSITHLDSLFSLKEIGGHLRIQQTALTDLNGLNNLDSVKNYLLISGNPSLVSLSGLENLKYVGMGLIPIPMDLGYFRLGIEINSNPGLTSLHGLKNVKSAKCLTISGNPLLTSLSGLDSLTYVGVCQDNYDGPNTKHSLRVWENANLSTLDGLNSLDTSVYEISISGNGILTSLSGLENLDFVGRWYVVSNDSLSVCNVLPLCTHLENGGPATVSDNAPGCNSVAEVEAACIVSIVETSTSEPAILLSPNPANHFLQIQVSDNEKWEISLFDLRGRLLYRQSVSGEQIIEVKGWPSGIYTLRAVSGERVFAGKIVKQ